MHLRFLEYFVTLARTKHFARAAEACHVTQPSLSSGISALEQEIGKRLIVRDRRFVGLTAEGHAILPWAQRLLADHEGLRQAAAEMGSLSGELRLGVIPASMPATGPLARSLMRLHPRLSVNIRSMTSRQIEQGLIEYELDAGLTYVTNEPPAQLVAVPLYAERYRFLTRADAALHGRDRIGWEEAAASPLCLLHQGMQNRRILDMHLASLGLAIEPKVTADSYVTLLALVEAGELSSIIPHSYTSLLPSDGRLRMIDFVDPNPVNEIGLVVLDREPRSPMRLAALEAARELEACSPFGAA